jgi:hypothetical protein
VLGGVARKILTRHAKTGEEQDRGRNRPDVKRRERPSNCTLETPIRRQGHADFIHPPHPSPPCPPGAGALAIFGTEVRAEAPAGGKLACIARNLDLLLHTTQRPIPVRAKKPTAKEVAAIRAAHESTELVPRRGLRTKAMYYEMGTPGTNPRMRARRAVVERLQRIASRLPEGHELVIYDAFRSSETQPALFKKIETEIRVKNPRMRDCSGRRQHRGA